MTDWIAPFLLVEGRDGSAMRLRKPMKTIPVVADVAEVDQIKFKLFICSAPFRIYKQLEEHIINIVIKTKW